MNRAGLRVLMAVLALACGSGVTAGEAAFEQVGLLDPNTFVQGDSPVDLLADPGRGMLYVLNQDINQVLSSFQGSLSFLQADGTFVANVLVGSGPVALTQSTLTGRLYVASKKSESFRILDPDTREMLQEVPLGTGIQPVDIDQDVIGGKQYIYILTPSRIYIWDEAQGSMLGNLPTHSQPLKLVINHTSDTVYILDANPTGGTVDLIRQNSSYISSQVGIGQVGMVIDEAAGKAYVLAKKDLATFEFTVLDEAGGAPQSVLLPQAFTGTDIAIDTLGRHLMIVGTGSLLHYGLDSLAPVNVVPLVGSRGEYLDTRKALWDPDAKRMWGGYISTLTRIPGWLAYDPNAQAVDLQSLGNGAQDFTAMALNPTAHRLYFAHPADDSVTVLENTTNTILKNAILGIFPSKILIDAARSRVYAVSAQSRLGEDGGSGLIAWLDLNTRLPTQIDMGSTSVDLALDPASGRVYTGGLFLTVDANDVLHPASGLVSAETNGDTGVVLLGGSFPRQLALDPEDRVYVISDDEVGPNEMALVSTGGTLLCKERALNPDLKALDISRVNNAAFVSSPENSSLIVFEEDTCPENSLPLQVPTGLDPRQVLVDDPTDRLYVANYGDGTVTVYTTSELVSPTGNHFPLATINLKPAGAAAAPHPVSMVLDPDEQRLYIANEKETYVSVIDTQSLARLGEIQGVATGTLFQVVDLVVERNVTPHRLQIIYNEYLDFFQVNTRGWLTTAELYPLPRVTRRQAGVRLSDIAIDSARNQAILSDLDTGSLVFLPADPPSTAPVGGWPALTLLALGLFALRSLKLGLQKRTQRGP